MDAAGPLPAALHGAAEHGAARRDGAGLRLALLNDWQRGFPLQSQPFARIGAALGLDEAQVCRRYRALLAEGAASRIGGVFAPAAGGAGVLAAMAVPPARLQAVAARVSALAEVNHNYEREHAWNLWFVVHGRDEAAIAGLLDRLQQDLALPLLRLPMQRAYRLDLGFGLTGRVGHGHAPARVDGLRIAADELPLAARVEAGLPVVTRPYEAWAEAVGWSEARVLATLQHWLEHGSLRRFGVIVRHHEAGFGANAMTVFDVPDDRVDACGAALARESGVTLAYRRARADGWPYNLYCMVHGRERAAVLATLAGIVVRAGLGGCAHQVLFSRRRFKQEGARRLRALHEPGAGHGRH